MSCTSTFFALYGELPATYQAGSDALLLSHSIKLEEIVFLCLKRRLITLWFCSLNTAFSSRNCWDGRYFFRKNSHVQIFTIVLQSSFLSLGGETDACKEKYISVWSCLAFLLAGSSGPEEHNRKEGLGEQRERQIMI